MIAFTNTIQIKRPVAEVFGFLADFENIPKWNYFVLEVRQLSAGPPGVASVYHQRRQTDEQEFRITEFEPNRKVTVKTSPGSSPAFERRLTLRAEGTATEVVDEWELDTGKPALLEKLTAGKVKSAVAENLAKLKELLETGQVVLQDGRKTSLD